MSVIAPVSPPRLDRLSALLDGLAPQVAIQHAGPLTAPFACPAETANGLHLHLLLAGTAHTGSQRLDAPAALLAQAGAASTVQPAASGTLLLSATIHFAGPAGTSLLDAVARPLALPLAGQPDELAPLLTLIGSEVAHPRCGHRSLLTHAVEIALIALLRHVIGRPGVGNGLLAALADPRIARAVVAMNERPGHPWTLESLSGEAGMSRTAFARTFRERMGMTPGHYLGGLRLALADQAVRAGEGLKRAAGIAGYASPAALSRALSRRRRPSAAPGIQPS